MIVDPVTEFQGSILIVAPHMDDEALACGGTIALLPHLEHLHVVLATDGMKSPAPIIPWRDSISPELGQIRMAESCAALSFLGVPEQNVHFLSLPEARLQKHKPALERNLVALIERIRPASVLIPFRYDRHPDHLAVNHVVMRILGREGHDASIYEYFVYFKWRLLPTRDLRRYIDRRRLLEIDTREVRQRKRQALGLYHSQTTLFYPWQTRPILTPEFLDEVSQTREMFLPYDAAAPGSSVFTRAVPWIRFVHRVEPFLKKWRDLTGAMLQRALGHNA